MPRTSLAFQILVQNNFSGSGMWHEHEWNKSLYYYSLFIYLTWFFKLFRKKWNHSKILWVLYSLLNWSILFIFKTVYWNGQYSNIYNCLGFMLGYKHFSKNWFLHYLLNNLKCNLASVVCKVNQFSEVPRFRVEDELFFKQKSFFRVNHRENNNINRLSE